MFISQLWEGHIGVYQINFTIVMALDVDINYFGKQIMSFRSLTTYLISIFYLSLIHVHRKQYDTYKYTV